MTRCHPRRNKRTRLLPWLLTVVPFFLLPVLPARADVVVLIEQPINLLGHIASTGHTALLLTTLCSDDHLHLRPCRAGEPGTVIGRYQGLAGHRDWLAMDPATYLYATSTLAAVPAFATAAGAATLRKEYENTHPFLLEAHSDEGDWVQLAGQSYRRTIFCLRVHTTPEQDARLQQWLNDDRNQTHYNFLYSNCADFVRRLVDVVFPGAVRRNLLFDAGMTTPRQLAASLHRYAKSHPELHFTVEVIPQVPGSIRRSGTVKGVTQSFVKTTPYLTGLAWLDPIPFGGVIASGLLDHRYDPQHRSQNLPLFDTGSLFPTAFVSSR